MSGASVGVGVGVGVGGMAGVELAPTRLLIADFDRATTDFLAEQLAVDGSDPRVSLTAEHARAVAADHRPELAIIGDLEHRRDALELLEGIRRGDHAAGGLDPRIGVIFLTRHDGELDVLRAFGAGADVVLGKPFSYPRLRASLSALLRRVRDQEHGPVLRAGSLVIDTRAHTAAVDGVAVQLCRREYELLAHLAAEPARVFTKHELLRDVWGFRAAGATRTLDSHACRLRRKLSGGGREFVINVWGVGYCLCRPGARTR